MQESMSLKYEPASVPLHISEPASVPLHISQVKIRVETGAQADYPYASIRAVAEGLELEVD